MTALLLEALGLLIGAAAVVTLVPASVLLLQSLAAFRRIEPETPDPTRPAPRVGVLIPAHDEAIGIGAAIASVRSQLGPADRLLVVADNCADATASVARAAGAEVTERHDPLRRGKGYALDHGVRHFSASPVEVVVIVDADCELAPGALARLARLADATGRPVQALYLMRSAEGASTGQRISEFAWRVRNQWRPLGCRALGWPCQLMGTGMAFPWSMIAAAPLASGHLVEDMELGLALASAGTPPLFCPEALVVSRFAADAAAGRTQRTRWEHGHLGMIASRALPMFVRGLRRGRPAVVAMALDLGVPPLAAFVIVQSGVLAVAGVLLLTTPIRWPGWLAVASAGATVVSIVAAWSRVGRDLLPPAALLSVPGYVLGKGSIYLSWFTRRQDEWIRTKRDDKADR